MTRDKALAHAADIATSQPGIVVFVYQRRDALDLSENWEATDRYFLQMDDRIPHSPMFNITMRQP